MNRITQPGICRAPAEDSVPELVGLFDSIQARGSADYMLRTVQQNNVQLTQLADQKANIVLGVASIMVTLTLGRALGEHPSHSLILLGGSTFGAALFALMALLPKLAKGCTPDADARGVNPLFFGACRDLTQEVFTRRMETVLCSDSEIYHAIVDDIYQQGRVLVRKYRYLRYSYTPRQRKFGACARPSRPVAALRLLAIVRAMTRRCALPRDARNALAKPNFHWRGVYLLFMWGLIVSVGVFALELAGLLHL